MATWGVAEAKAKFSAMVEQAQIDGPQQITKSGRPIAVVISMEDWQAKPEVVKPKESLVEFLRNSPLNDSEIKIERVRIEPRHIDF